MILSAFLLATLFYGCDESPTVNDYETGEVYRSDGSVFKAPIANTGSDISVKESEIVQLDASGSRDEDGEIVSYAWSENGVVLSEEKAFTKSDFSSGEHTIVLTVTDNDAQKSEDSVIVTIVVNQAVIDTAASSEAADTSVSAQAVSVRVSDAYVMNATVTMGGVAADIEVEGSPGMYEWINAYKGAFVVAIRATNDINRNGIADASDSYAPALSAPEGYEHINPFTTMKVNGVSSSTLFINYPNSFNIDPNFDFDVVAASKSNFDLAKEVLKAALTLATEQVAAEQAYAPKFRVCERPSLPADGPNGEKGIDSITLEPCFLDSSDITNSSSEDSSSSASNDFELDVDLAADGPALDGVAKRYFDLILGDFPISDDNGGLLP